MIVDVPNSGVALAVNQITRDKGKAFLVSGGGLVGPDRQGVLAQHHPLDLRHLGARQRHRQRDREDGRRHAGSSSPPTTPSATRSSATPRRSCSRTAARCSARCGTRSTPPDFSSFLLQAQASKAKIIGLANAGGDTTNAIKQAAEFGIVKGGQNFAGLLVFLTDVHALGLQTAQGLIFTETFYWDMNDKTRAFAKRFAERNRGIHPDHDPRRRLRRRRCTT